MKKYICYFENQFCATSMEFLRLDKEGGILIGSHSPVKTDSFKTKKEAKEWGKKYVAHDEVKVIEFSEAEKEFNKWVENGMIYRELPVRDLVLSKCFKDETPEEVLEWHLANQVAPESSVAYEDHKTWPALFTVFEHIHEAQSFSDDSEGQGESKHTIQMAMSKNANYETFEKELSLIRDRITHTDDEGNKIIPIFDHTLSASGTYYFHICADEKYMITHRYTDDKVFSSLREAFDYWKENHWYWQ